MKKMSRHQMYLEFETRVYANSGDIELCLEDLNNITENNNYFVMGVAEETGALGASTAINSILTDFENHKVPLMGADVLVYFQTHPDYDIAKLGKAMEALSEKCDSNVSHTSPYLIFGTSSESSLARNYVKVTIFMGCLSRLAH